MTDKESKLPAHLRPPYTKPRNSKPPYRDQTGDQAAGRADRDRKKTWEQVFGRERN